MIRTAPASLAALTCLVLAGCAAPTDATLEITGAGGGGSAREINCDGEAGTADALLAVTGSAQAGVASVLVRDGLGEEVLQRHIATGSGEVAQETPLLGAPGEWTLEERRSEDFRGALRARLTCGG